MQKHDLVVRNGVLVDGTGLLRRRADVAVTDGRIAAVGRVHGSGDVEIDADGKVVAPGLVDIHTHYDPQLTFDPFATSSCYHGVTTVVTGNCGFSVAPVRTGDADWLVQLFARVEGMDVAALSGVPFDRFETFPQLLQEVDGALGVNAAFLVGHSGVRRYVMGPAAQERPADASEIGEMRRIVSEAVEAGALGLSSSHAASHLDLAGRPVPSRLATTDELVELADAAATSGAAVMGYLPASVVAGGLDADDEALILRMSRLGAPVVIQGLGARSKVDAPTEAWDQAQRFVAEADRQATPVYSMTMSKPYNRTFDVAGGTTLYEGVPEVHRLFLAPAEARRALALDPEFRRAAKAGMAAPNADPAQGPVLLPPSWDRVSIERTAAASWSDAVGRSLAEVAADRRTDPLDVMLDVAAEDLATVFVWRTESPGWIAGMRVAQRDPHMLIGTSDGGAHLDRDDGAEASSYFLARWVREWRAFTLEEGIRQLTAIPAALCGFVDRGCVLPGWAADLVVFDPEVIAPGEKRFVHDLPGGAGRWTSTPVGVEWTIVNGVPIVHRGELCDATARPGRVLRPGR